MPRYSEEVRRLPVKEDAKTLLLSYVGAHYEELSKEARETRMSYEDFLETCLNGEVVQRRERRVQRKIREGRFPHSKYLQDLALDEYDIHTAGVIEELMTLNFIRARRNVICIGNPGRGKSHLAIALGISACLSDMRVLFTNVPNLVIELKEAMSRNQVTAYKRKFNTYELVIIDELGYVSFDRQGNEILFNLLSNRNETGSMIITTNLAFERWEEVFHDTNLTGALVDRLTHKAYVLDMSGESYRLKETRQFLEK